MAYGATGWTLGLPAQHRRHGARFVCRRIGAARLAKLRRLGNMRVTHDAEADAAYIYLADIEPGGAKASVAVETGDAAAGGIVLDFDREGRLIGIEIIGAARGVPTELLREANRID